MQTEAMYDSDYIARYNLTRSAILDTTCDSTMNVIPLMIN